MDQQMEKKQEGEEQLLMDFSSMFKGKRTVRKVSKIGENKQSNQTPNWLLQIPASLTLTRAELENRKVFETCRWMCVVKAEKEKEKLMAAVISCWNYFYSDKGHGQKNSLSFQSGSLIIRDRTSPQQDEFKRIEMIEEMIKVLNEETDSKLKAEVVVKFSNPNKVDIGIQEQKNNLLNGLKIKNESTFIYLAYEDVFCPIGYEITPLRPLDAYVKLEDIDLDHQQLWIMSSCMGSGEESFSIKRWSDIQKDLSTSWPEFMDIREHKRGVMMRPDVTEENKSQKRGSSHCIIKISRK